MRLMLIVMLTLLAVGLTYVLWRIWQILPLATYAKAAVFLIPAAALVAFGIYISGAVDKLPLNFAGVVYEWGTSWIMVLLYAAMLFLLLDVGKWLHIIPASFLRHSPWGSLTVVVLLVGIFVYGNLNYRHKVRMPLQLTTRKVLDKPLKIVMLSDVHLGYHNRRAEFARWVDLINAEKADLVLIAGDIIDGNMRPLWQENTAQEFRRINAPVYACLGNHEYIGGEGNSERFYREAGITLLRDAAVKVKGINIVGRDDRTNPHRLPLDSLTSGIDKARYTILLDHQPYNLEQAEQAGIDFQLSGHTHYGQVWPVSWVEDALYERAYGALTKGATRYFVTSGIGIWGGKFRIGTQSEYLVAELSAR